MKWPVSTLRVFPTFRCTRACDYCAVKMHGDVPKYKEVKPSEWISLFEQLDDIMLLLISGGEPSLYPGIVGVVNAGLQMGWAVGLYSNCAPQLVEVAHALKPDKNLFFDCSYHAGMEDLKEYILRWRDIRGQGHRISAATIAHPGNIQKCYDDILPFYRATGYRMVLKPLDGLLGDKWYSDHAERGSSFGEPKAGKCLRNDLLCAPDGDVYRCHHFLYKKDQRGVVWNINGLEAPIMTEYACTEVNTCNPCDTGRRRIDGVSERRT